MANRRITKVEPTPKIPAAKQNKGKQMVAAYARVSTNMEGQQGSITAQKEYYEQYIKSKPEWKFVKIYADAGATGTSYHKREAFNRMIEDAFAGKINLILTKSISRFARNTVDTLNIVRKLREIDVTIYFERENIYTNDAKGEFLITLLSSLAQEEARSISENVTWGVRKKFQQGKVSVPYGRFLGYDKGTEKFKMIVNEEEAVIVKRIYRMYFQGYTAPRIAKTLTDEGVAAPGGGETWWSAVIKRILSNEKYKGDALLQKVYTADFISKKKRKNKGELPQYYVTDDHEAIIPPALFDYAQEVRKHRQENESEDRYSGTNTFSSKFVCAECGANYGLRPWHSTSYNYMVWQCHNRYKKNCKGAPHIYDSFLPYLLSVVMQKLMAERSAVIDTLLKTVGRTLGEEKQAEVQNHIECMADISPEQLYADMDGFPIIIDKIMVDVDRMLHFKFIDGSCCDCFLLIHSPRRGIQK